MKTFAVCALLALLAACAAPAGVLGDSRRALRQNETADATAAGPAAESACLTPSDKDGYTCMLTPPGLEAMTVHWVLGPVAADDMNDDKPAPGEGEISLLLEGQTTGWVAYAYASEAASMNPADCVLGYVEDDGTVVVKNYNVQTKSISADDEDTSIELTNIKGKEEDGVTTIEFTRKLDVGQFPINATAGPIRTNAAHGADGEDGLIYHATNRVTFATDKMTGATG